MTSQRISLSGSPSFAGTRSISADGDLYGLVSNEILILSSADGVLYETSFKRHNVNDHRAATSDSPLQNARTSPLRVHRIVIHRSLSAEGLAETDSEVQSSVLCGLAPSH